MGRVGFLFLESVHFVRAVDLDVGDERERVGEIEVFACWGSWLVGHGAMRGTGVRYEKVGERVADLVLNVSWQHDGTVFESGRRAAKESLSGVLRLPE